MPDFTWAPLAGRFRDPTTGRFVSDATVRSGVDALVAESASRMAALARRYRDGEITVSAWLDAHLAEVKAVNVAAAMAAQGGRDAMTPADWGRVGAHVRAQYQYSQAMVDDVLNGRQRLNGRLDVRAGSYANHARLLFEGLRRMEAAGRGAMRERNVINSRESCTGCQSESARGWVPMGQLIPVGSRSPCGPRCRCTIEVERAPVREMVRV